MSLPVPWIGPGAIDVADPDKIRDSIQDSPITEQNSQLIEILRRAMSHTDMLPAGLDIPRHVRCAQVMLEMAVEWRVPDVERWAVAWLLAAGGRHLRLRWSSRARDGRFRQESAVAGQVISVAADEDRAVLGLASGGVVSWADSGVQSSLLPPGESPVWTIAVRGRWVVAAGQRNWFAASGWPSTPPTLLPPRNGQKAAAISPAGAIALGDELGRIQIWIPGDEKWTQLCGGTSRMCAAPGERCTAAGERCAGTGAEVVAVAFAGDSAQTIRSVWASGEVSELSMAGGSRHWRRLHTFGAPVHAAAWSQDGAILAAVTGQAVWRVCLSPDRGVTATPLWTQDGVHAIAWSATGALAAAGVDQIYCSAAPVRSDSTEVTYKTITSDGLIDAIALPGSDHVVSVRGDQLVQWELNGAGSDDPTFSAKDPITAVGVRPGDRRHTIVGTGQGQLHSYDATGMQSPWGRLSNRSNIKQLAWFERDRFWLVGTLDGVYTYRPGDGRSDDRSPDEDRGTRLAGGLCLHVAAAHDRFAYAIGDRIITSDGRAFGMRAPVADLCFDPVLGDMAAIDEDGHLLVDRPRHVNRSTPISDFAPGTRLLAIDGSMQLIREPQTDTSPVSVRWTSKRGDRAYSDLPAGFSGAVSYDVERIIVTYPGQGILLTGTSSKERSWVDTRATAVAVSGGRIAVATPHHVAGFDVLDGRTAAAGEVGAAIRLKVQSCDEQSTDAGFKVTLPEGRHVRVGGEALGKLMESASQRVDDLSAAVFRAGQIGDLLWQEGLGLAIDYARGEDPNRAVRLEWDCPTGDLAADRFPWELLHPSTAPLGWFGEPPVTAVRVVPPATAGGDPQQARSGFTQDPTMLVLRGADRELRAVDEAFDRFRRRTRRTRVRLRTARPREVDSLALMAEALKDQADVLQLWAHSGDLGVRLSRAEGMVPTHVLADLVAQAAPRLVVLVGCSSGALGRALVTRGVPAAVAMRVPVYDHTVQPLVEDVTAAALAGERVDLAFAAALRTYLFTGQPGASAVPMLYLAEGSDGVLFRNPHAPLP